MNNKINQAIHKQLEETMTDNNLENKFFNSIEQDRAKKEKKDMAYQNKEADRRNSKTSYQRKVDTVMFLIIAEYFRDSTQIELTYFGEVKLVIDGDIGYLDLSNRTIHWNDGVDQDFISTVETVAIMEATKAIDKKIAITPRLIEKWAENVHRAFIKQYIKKMNYGAKEETLVDTEYKSVRNELSK